jgi:hypothetical protein
MGKPPQQQQQTVVSHYAPKPDTRTMNLMDKMKITYEEFKRRDEIVQELFRMCPYIKGDRVVPKDAEKRRKYGIMTIQGMCRSLFDLEHDDIAWPPNDNPMIVTCSTESGEMTCTTNFFIRAPNGGQC